MITNLKLYRPRLIGISLIGIAAIGFSAKAILVKLAYSYGSQIDPLTLMNLRMAFAMPVFFAVAVWSTYKRQYRLSCKEWISVTLLGFTGYYLASFLDFAGLTYISASLERLVLFIYPTLVVVFTAYVRKTLINRYEIAALALTYIGIFLVVITDESQQKPEWVLGVLLVFASAVAFALFTIGSSAMIQRLGAMQFTAYTMSIACIMTCTHFALTGTLPVASIPAPVIGLSLLMAIVSTIIPAFLMAAGIKRVGASTASIISAIGPVMTVGLGYLLLNESLNFMQMVGTVLIIAGVLTISLEKQSSGKNKVS